MDKIQGVERIEFNIYADSPEEADEMKVAITDFIEWFRKRGVKVTAKKVATAVNGWEKSTIVRNRIISYMYGE